MVSKKTSALAEVTDAEDFVPLVEPELPEKTRQEMEAGRQAQRDNAAKMAHAVASRLAEENAKATAEAEVSRQQAEDKLRAVEEAEAAHRARAGV
jgi:hypothetical protein